MAVAARDRFQIQQNVVKNVKDWDKFIKTVKRSVHMQGANIVLRASHVKQRVGNNAGELNQKWKLEKPTKAKLRGSFKAKGIALGTNNKKKRKELKMNYYISILSAVCLNLFIVFSVFADDINLAMDKKPFIRQVSSPLINLPNRQVPFESVLTGGQPTFDQLKQAAETGFKAVINLRAKNELPDTDQEKVWVEGSGMNYIHIPVAVTEGLTPQNAKVFADVLSKVENYPLIVHCKSGERVGAMFALKVFHIDEKEIDEALLVGERAGLVRLAPVVKQILERYKK